MKAEEKRPSKILYLITKSNWGGAGRYVFDLVSHLPKDIYEGMVVLGGEGELKEKLAEKGVRTISIQELGRDVSVFKDMASFIKLLKIIWQERPDIVHINSSKAGLLGSIATRLVSTFSFLRSKPHHQKPRVVFTAHGWPFKEKRGGLFRFISYFGSWATVLLADKTIVVSKDDYKKTYKFWWGKKNIRLVKNGITLPSFLAREQARTALGIPETPQKDEILIGTISELHKNKGLETAIKAFSLVLKEGSVLNRNCKMVIIGEGGERENLARLLDGLNLKEEVFLVGAKPEAASLLNAFDIFFLSSLKEGLPYAILEAGAAGLPTAASSVGGIPEIITDMKSGILVKPSSPAELKQALMFLITQSDRRQNFGKKLREIVLNDFSLAKMLKKTFEVYAEL
ncbi:MAG: glycosyltransferase family 4 protein [bacterium]|nr:glycosyltransferase family 4 protein [bacterium]